MRETLEFVKSLEGWVPFATTLLGTFLGAFLGFVFGQVTEKVKRNRKRWADHYNGMVRLEVYVNEVWDILAGNRYLARRVIDSRQRQGGGTVITWDAPHPLPKQASVIDSCLRSCLINKFFSFNVKVRRLNSDTGRICEAYSQMRGAFLGKNINHGQYNQSLEEYRGNMAQLLKAYDLMDEATLELLTLDRACLKKDGLHNNRSFVFMPKPIQVTDEELLLERKQGLDEAEAVRKESRVAIEQFLGDSGV